jgi:hypothetical protein
MRLLLVRLPRRRLAHDASFRHSQATVFHHARTTAGAVRAVAIPVIEPALRRPLMATTSLA